jgi:hypothetical protein
MKNRKVLPHKVSTPLRFAQKNLAIPLPSASAPFFLQQGLEEAEDENHKISMQSP